jgi:hypothetical protein
MYERPVKHDWFFIILPATQDKSAGVDQIDRTAHYLCSPGVVFLDDAVCCIDN